MDVKGGTRKVAAIIVAIAAFLLGVGLFVLLRYQRPSTVRPADEYAGDVVAESATGSAIVQGALDYVGTHPQYASRYYAGGWPDDGYGVCTDVVARALLAAGYDLQTLMAEDIATDPEAYGIETPDPNIDFRRVSNQQMWLSRHATSLTCDISDVDAWQGGDIVVFHEHVGVVSDRRCADGVPYVIHHEGPWQAAYEQDVLQRRSDILGHYRVE